MSRRLLRAHVRQSKVPGRTRPVHKTLRIITVWNVSRVDRFSMPYILIRGNLASYGHKHPFRVLVSGLKAADIEQLNRFPCGGYSDESTVVYLQHPCVMLTALEVLGYRVVASSSTAVKQDYNEYMWTMRKEFSDPEPYLSETSSAVIERDNLANSGREGGNYNGGNSKIDVPE